MSPASQHQTRSSMDPDLRRRSLLARDLVLMDTVSPFILVQPGQGRSPLSPASRLMTTRLSRRSHSSPLDDTATSSSLAWLGRRILLDIRWWALGGLMTGPYDGLSSFTLGFSSFRPRTYLRARKPTDASRSWSRPPRKGQGKSVAMPSSSADFHRRLVYCFMLGPDVGDVWILYI
jgi:hypothetical protein